MRVIFVLTRFIVGGSEIYVFEKVKWLKQRGISCMVVSSGGNNLNMLDGVVDHVTIHNLDKNPILLSRSECMLVLNDLVRSIDVFGATHIECFELNPAKYVFAVKERLSLGIGMNMMVLSELGFKNDIALQIVSKFFERSNSLFTLNEGMSVHINKDSLIPLKFQYLNIPIVTGRRSTALTQHGIPYILSVSRLSYDKEYVLELVDAFSRVGNSIANTHLVIIGDGPNRALLQEKIEELDDSARKRITLLGSLSSEITENYIKDCSLFVGMGTSLLLAAKYNKLCLVTSPVEGWRRGTIGLYSDKMRGGFGQLFPGVKLEAFDDYLMRIFCHEELFEPSSLNVLRNFHDSDSIYIQWLELYENASLRGKYYYVYSMLFTLYISLHKFYRFIRR